MPGQVLKLIRRRDKQVAVGKDVGPGQLHGQLNERKLPKNYIRGPLLNERERKALRKI